MDEIRPTDPLVGPLLTDLYELTAAYAYWKAGRHDDPAAFELFFRSNPFGGEFTIFAGLEEVLRLVASYRFTDADVDHVRRLLPHADRGFFEFLGRVDCSRLRIRAAAEGSLVFPNEPLIRVEGPLAIGQMLETALLVLTSYPSLVATNAARMRLAAGPDKSLLEFGLRRAQGPDGALSASRYSYLGGFDATSNVEAHRLFGIPPRGTQMHAFVQSFTGLDDLPTTEIVGPDGRVREFLGEVLRQRGALGAARGNEGELAAFVAYAQAFPAGFLALIDTYDTLGSGLPNFLAVALALDGAGYRPVGVRLDSGDLAYLSREVRAAFRAASRRFGADLAKLTIVASSEIDEAVLLALRQQGHEIDVFGVGTRLVTCYNQPSLNCVYKLVETRGQPRIKLSDDVGKMTIPGAKDAYRLVGADGRPLADLLSHTGRPAPRPGETVLCRHPFDEAKRARVVPAAVEQLLLLVWDGRLVGSLPKLDDSRARAAAQLGAMREDHLRAVNPTPYKVSVDADLFQFTRDLRLREAPVGELR